MVVASVLYTLGSWFESKRADNEACYAFGMRKWLTWNNIAQVGLVGFTAGGYFLVSIKLPEWGLLAALASQVFWFYASWRAWKEAQQIGVMITTVIICSIVVYGVLNYWIL